MANNLNATFWFTAAVEKDDGLPGLMLQATSGFGE
jgi:hypothetical protein